MQTTIASVTGKMVLDSRLTPTLSVTVEGSDGSMGTFSVPSGASTGVHEAHELRDNGTSHGGVVRALAMLEDEIAPALIGVNLCDQFEIDTKLIALDGTPNKERLGGNTMIGVSIAAAKAAALSQKKEVWDHLHTTYWSGTKPAFPRLYANLVNGGKHAETMLAFQEYHVVPKTTNMAKASALIKKIQTRLQQKIVSEYGPTKTGDEGGFALAVADIEVPLILLKSVIDELGVGDKVDLALDVAASSFFNSAQNRYQIGGVLYDDAALITLYERLSTAYRLISIEDPFQEEDFASFASLAASAPGVLRVGDDLTTTNKERLARAIREKSIDAIIIKPNQIGTLSETVETMKLAQENGIKCIVSHRSGETLDPFIADLAYASGAYGIKLGAHGPREREAKYARLIAIEQAN